MTKHLHSLSFNRSLNRDLHATPISVHKHNSTIMLGICFFSFFLLNPFFAIFIMALFSLLVSVNSKSILLILTIALTIFYSSRAIGVSWGTGMDDAGQYIFNYQNSLNKSIYELFMSFYLNRSKTEFFYYVFWWIIGKLFNPTPETFIFLIYLIQITLLSIAAYLVSKRYVLIFIFIFYFGLIDPNHQILHLWRASFSFFIFLIGILIYFKGNKKIGRILVYVAIGFHVSIIINVILFELFNILMKRKRFIITAVQGGIIVLIASLFFIFAMSELIPKAYYSFNYNIKAHIGMARIAVYGVVLITLVLGNYYYRLSKVSQFSSFLFIMYLILLFQLGLNNPIMTRLLQIMVPIVGIVLFEIVMKQSKRIIVFIIIILYLHVITSPSSEMFLQMIPEYKNPFHGALNILYF